MRASSISNTENSEFDAKLSFNFHLCRLRWSIFIPCSLFFVAYFVGADVALAQAAGGPPQPGFGEVFSRMLPMFALVFMIYYFMIVKPQQLKLKAQKDLTSALKKGDSVVTTSGILGKVGNVDTEFVSIEIAPNVKIKVELSHVARKIDGNGEGSGVEAKK